MKTNNYGSICGRRVELFCHSTEPEWGYEKDQTDTFAVIYPKNYDPKRAYPLYVVLHSAGHDVYSAFAYTWAKGNHDIYKSPDDVFALYLDCRANGGDWWWGGIGANGDGAPERGGTETQPVEKRCIATVEWMTDTYKIDPDRIYAVGNSMGGSGALGIALRRGDIFSAIKVNVPAGVRHAADRCCLDVTPPEGFSLPEPPVVLDYSSQTDSWSAGHEVLYRCMREKRYALHGYWGEFGHENNDSVIAEYNDLIHALPVLDIRKCDPYPVFTHASTDDENPWEHPDTKAASGQVNGFFRWEVVSVSEDRLEIKLWLLSPDEWKTRVALPCKSTADVLIRRTGSFKLSAGEKFIWSFGDKCGTSTADGAGHPDISSLEITSNHLSLVISKI